MNLYPIDLPSVLERVDRDGAAGVPLLRDADLTRLLDEADRLSFVTQPEVVANGLVRQGLSVHEPLTGPPFVELRDALQTALCDAAPPDLFATPLALDTLVLQRYEPGSVGITPHRDGPSRINLVCVVVLEGEARFAVCDDRAGSNPRDVRAPPGHVILMRAPGYRGSDHQPFHFVTDLRERRTIVGLRQRRPSPPSSP